MLRIEARPAVSQPAKRRSEHADARIGEVERTLRADEQRPALESSRGIGATFDAVVRHVIEKEVEKTPTAATKGYGAITGEVVNIYNGQVTIGENVMNGGLIGARPSPGITNTATLLWE